MERTGPWAVLPRGVARETPEGSHLPSEYTSRTVRRERHSLAPLKLPIDHSLQKRPLPLHSGNSALLLLTLLPIRMGPSDRTQNSIDDEINTLVACCGYALSTFHAEVECMVRAALQS